MIVFHLVTLLLAVITVSFARTVIQPNNNILECEECKLGVPYVPVEVIVTPPPENDDCVEGKLDVSAELPPITPAPPPPC